MQLDEPVLVQDQPRAVLDATARAYRELTAAADRPKVLVATYFDALGEALPVLAQSPVEGLALDFTGPAAANLDALASLGGLPGKRLVAGVVDGRNVWADDLEASLATLATLLGLTGHLDVAPSCSLLHVPLDLTRERTLDLQVTRWLAFARQKLDETVTWRAPCPRAGRPSPRNWPRAVPPGPHVPPPPSPTTPPYGPAARPPAPTTPAAPSRTGSGRRRSGTGSACPRCRRRPSARSRRPPTCAPPARPCGRGS